MLFEVSERTATSDVGVAIDPIRPICTAPIVYDIDATGLEVM
jgi:hypothetical protein